MPVVIVVIIIIIIIRIWRVGTRRTLEAGPRRRGRAQTTRRRAGLSAMTSVRGRVALRPPVNAVLAVGDHGKSGQLFKLVMAGIVGQRPVLLGKRR